MYPQQILDAEHYFAPLAHFIDAITSNKFAFKTKLKQTYWQCEWTERDDTALLKGIYEHGYGNWEWIKADTGLGLGEKILMVDEPLVEEDTTELTTIASVAAAAVKKSSKTKGSGKVMLKPQSKHLRTRIDYLIKVLQNQINTEKYGPEWKKKKESSSSKKSSSRKKTSEFVDDEANGHSEKSSRKK